MLYIVLNHSHSSHEPKNRKSSHSRNSLGLLRETLN
jgi:hypothetical protein